MIEKPILVMKRYIGVDVSKKTFTVAYSSDKKSKTSDFENTPKGIKKFIGTLKPEDHCVFEATGNYGMNLLYMLNSSNIAVSMENPQKIKNFAKAMLTTTKTDSADAKMIALYGEKMQPAEYKVPSEEILTLKQKRSVLRQLKRQLVMNLNLKESLKVLPKIDTKALRTVDDMINFIQKQIEKVESDMASVAEETFSKQVKLLESVKGIGKTLAVALIVSTGGFTYFSNSKQYTKFIGLAPIYEQSGSSINYHGHINKNGDPYLRAQIYIASLSAFQHNTECKKMYKRLCAAGKPKQVAVIACSHKLIRQAFAVIKNDTPYRDGYISENPMMSKTRKMANKLDEFDAPANGKNQGSNC